MGEPYPTIKTVRIISAALAGADANQHKIVNVSLTPLSRVNYIGVPEYNEFPVFIDAQPVTNLLGSQNIATGFTQVNGTGTDLNYTAFGKEVFNIANTAASATHLSNGTFTAGANIKFETHALLKYNGNQWILQNFTDNTTNGFWFYFDVLNGLVGQNNTGGNGVADSATIYPLGQGWFLTITVGHLTGTDGNMHMEIRPVNGNGSTVTAAGQSVLAAGPGVYTSPLAVPVPGLPNIFIPGYNGPA